MLLAVVCFHDTSSRAASQRVIKTNALSLWGEDSCAFPTRITSFSQLFEATQDKKTRTLLSNEQEAGDL